MSDDKRTCETCGFSQVVDDVGDEDMVTNEKGEVVDIQEGVAHRCRRMPPVHLQNGCYAAWPWVSPRSWCGKWMSGETVERIQASYDE